MSTILTRLTFCFVELADPEDFPDGDSNDSVESMEVERHATPEVSIF